MTCTSTTFWFILIAVLWTGYFVLDGFDFGVGMLLPCSAATTPTAGCASTRSARSGTATRSGCWPRAVPPSPPSRSGTRPCSRGFYLALLLILVGLIVRGVSLRVPRQGRLRPVARSAGTWRSSVSSFLPSLLWGVAFTNVVRGVPLNAAHHFTGNLLTLLNPIALLGGAGHDGGVRSARRCLPRAEDRRRPAAPRARGCAYRLAAVAVALAAASTSSIIQAQHGRAAADVVAAARRSRPDRGVVATMRGREGWAFAATAAALAFVVSHAVRRPVAERPAVEHERRRTA